MFLFKIDRHIDICFLFVLVFLQKFGLKDLKQLFGLAVGYQFRVEVDRYAVAELDSQKDRVLHLVPYVRGRYVVVEALRVIFDDYLAFTLAFVLPFYELLL